MFGSISVSLCLLLSSSLSLLLCHSFPLTLHSAQPPPQPHSTLLRLISHRHPSALSSYEPSPISLLSICNEPFLDSYFVSVLYIWVCLVYSKIINSKRRIFWIYRTNSFFPVNFKNVLFFVFVTECTYN